MLVTEALTVIKQEVRLKMSADADDALRTAIDLGALNTVFQAVDAHKDWWWKYSATASLTASSTGVVDLPTDFAGMGDAGVVWFPTNRHSVDAVSVQEMRAIRRSLISAGSTEVAPRRYSIYGRKATSPFKPQMNLDVIAPASILVDYMTATPILNTGVNNELLNRIPENYHRTVLIAGVKAMYRHQENKKGSGPFTTDPEYLSGLRLMSQKEATGREATTAIVGYRG